MLVVDNRRYKKQYVIGGAGIFDSIFGRPLGQAYAIGNPSVCNVGVLWPNGLSDRDDFWHTPCPGQQ